MKNMRRTLLGGVVLLICMAALGLPALAASSGATTVTGTVPLIAYDVQASGITDSAAIISWRTNGNATSRVFYDTRSHDSVTEYKYDTPEDTAPVLEHSVGLDGLRPATTYHYRIKSAASIGGVDFTAISPDNTFTTLSRYIAPRVTTIGAWALGPTQAFFLGMLDNMGTASSVQVYFQWGQTESYGFETDHQTRTSAPHFIFAFVSSLTPNTIYHLRAVAAGDGISYGQDRVFRTMPLPTITVVTPNGGESWKAGTRHTISWTYTGISGNVKIELIKGGVLNRVITNSTPIGAGGNGSFSWVIPSNQTAGTDYKIRVTSLSEPACTDTSNNNFTITKQ
jgi:hypothetical protein